MRNFSVFANFARGAQILRHNGPVVSPHYALAICTLKKQLENYNTSVSARLRLVENIPLATF